MAGLQELEQISPNSPQMFALRAANLCRASEKDYESDEDLLEGLKSAQKSLALDPSNALAYGVLGRISYLHNDYRKAVDAFSKAVEFESTNPEWYYNRAFAFEALGEQESARSDYSSIISLDNNCALAYAYRANNNFMQNRLAEAISDGRASLSLDASSAFATRILAKTYYENKEFGEALKCLEQYRPETQNDSWAALELLRLKVAVLESLSETALAKEVQNLADQMEARLLKKRR